MEFINKYDYGVYLKDNGFTLLTGEACNVSMRMLVDLDQKGVNILQEFLGIYKENIFNGNHNSSHTNSEGNEVKHIASIMLAHSLIWGDLIYFIAIFNGYSVAVTEDGMYIWHPSEEEKPTKKNIQRYIIPYDAHPHIGFGNVHAFTGRVY